MSGAWFFGLSVAVNIVAAILYVKIGQQLRRIEQERRAMRRAQADFRQMYAAVRRGDPELASAREEQADVIRPTFGGCA